MLFVGMVVVTGLSAAAMSFAVGANDVANALGTSVGSKALSLKGGILVGSIMEFLGCLAMGGNVSTTLASGLVKIDLYSTGNAQARMYMTGMFSALLGSAIWLLLATHYGMPVSTTHTIVSGVCMFGVMVHGFDGIEYDKLEEILWSWLLSPVLGIIIGYGFYWIVDRFVISTTEPHRNAKAYLPLLLGIAFFGILQLIFLDVIMGMFGYDEDDGVEWVFALVSLGLTIAIAIAARFVLFVPILIVCGKLTANPNFVGLLEIERSSGEIPDDLASLGSTSKEPLLGNASPGGGGVAAVQSQTINHSNNNAKSLNPSNKTPKQVIADLYFVPLQILSAAFVAFAHGANDIANSIGPFAAVYEAGRNPDLSTVGDVPYWIIVYGAFFIVLGICLYGYNVMATIGEKVIPLTCAKGFCVEMSTAWTVLLATYFGIPVSTTHCVVSSVIGVGMVEDKRLFNIRLIAAIVASWVLTVPAGAFFTMHVLLWLLGVDALWMNAIEK